MSESLNRLAPSIAVITHRFVRTHGQGRINLELVRYLAARGRVVHVIGEECDHAILADPNIRPAMLAPSRVPTDLLRNLEFARRSRAAVDQIRRDDPEMIVISNGAATAARAEINIAMFVHAAWWMSPMHPRFNRGASAGWVWKQYQSLYTRFNKRAERSAFRSADVCVGLADIVRGELIDAVGVNLDRAVTIMPGVDCEEFRPAQTGEAAEFRRSVGTAGNSVVALFAGDIRTNRKNLDLVLRAMALLPAEVELWVAGSTDGSPYPAIADRLGIASRIRWLGHREDMPLVTRCADFFLFPSHYEPFGLVVLEALASGIPAIVTAQTGAADAVRGEAGLVLKDASDIDAMVNHVRSWLADRMRLENAKRAARNEALKHTWAAMGAQYDELIERVADDKKRRME